jgi:hypothetical protein
MPALWKNCGNETQGLQCDCSFKGLRNQEGSLISDINDPERITVDYFQKGADAVCVPQYQRVQTDEEYTIFDCSSLRTLRKAGKSKQHYAGKWKSERRDRRARKIRNGGILKARKADLAFQSRQKKIAGIG